MSRSNPTATNPAKRFFRWSGSKGKLTWYDKENQQEVEIDFPFAFLVLDQLATITGYSDQDQSSFWSNEVRNVTKDQLTVRTSKGTKQTGLYADLTDVRSKGAKYAKSVYIAFYDNKELVLGNLKASGTSLTAWIELCNSTNVENGKVRLISASKAKKGATEYFTPNFEAVHSSEEEDAKAIELDKELQAYLNTYLVSTPTDHGNDDGVDWVPSEDELNATLNDRPEEG
jgi:hypothetical protein